MTATARVIASSKAGGCSLPSATCPGRAQANALDISLLVGASPWIEPVPLARTAEAVERMRSAAAKVRIVLVMEAKDADQ